ncbi:hypothetical protein [Rugosimonospora africana]|nr:hypothetical protein [Rugosimonospora africana]
MHSADSMVEYVDELGLQRRRVPRKWGPSAPSTGATALDDDLEAREHGERSTTTVTFADGRLQELLDRRRGDLVWISDGPRSSTRDLAAASTTSSGPLPTPTSSGQKAKSNVASSARKWEAQPTAVRPVWRRVGPRRSTNDAPAGRSTRRSKVLVEDGGDHSDLDEFDVGMRIFHERPENSAKQRAKSR